MIRSLLSVTVLWVVATAFGDDLASKRIDLLPVAEQIHWESYVERSRSNALNDAAALQKEVLARRMTNALRAPSGGDFKLPAKPRDVWYASDEARQLANIILSYQTPSGGWSKHVGYNQGPRQPGMQWTSQNEPGEKAHYLATFDNRATTEEMYFLAQVWYATKHQAYKSAFIKGLNFILAAQYPNGGWPQVYPLEGGYHDYITFNDDAMMRILELLYAVKCDESYNAFLDERLRHEVGAALDAGIQCVLRAQVVQGGQKTVWCAQYDPLRLRPAAARAMEPATLSGMESASILRFLMTLTNPTPEVVASIESGLEWLDRAKITGLSRTNLNGRTTFISDTNAAQVYWARFYNLTNSRPVFPGRDGVVYDSFPAMASRNALGYDYLSTQPGSIINNGQKRWRKMLADEAKGRKGTRL